MIAPDEIFLGASRTVNDAYQKPEVLKLGYANRHGLITGATGTGKTVSLQVLAEGFSRAGVPVFAADIKGDLSGVAAPGEAKAFIDKRVEDIRMDQQGGLSFERSPTVFWDLFGEQGHPIRATVSEMGPLLLSRLMNLTDAQEGVLNIAFELADEEGLLLLDLKDLQSLLTMVSERRKELSGKYGNVAAQSVGAIQRSLLVLERQGAEHFFGEPALKIADLMRTDRDGRGMINILAADRLMMNPRLYGTFLLWLLSELFEELPEVGDPERPKLVFFFDEAHLLFDDAPDILIERIEQVVRLIRSKGVGVYFVTQNPLDVPDTVLAQLGNRIQHALRAYTPREQKAVKTAAETFRPNPDFDCYEAITQLGVGEALVSTLESKGVPSVVQRTLIRPPSSRIGPLSDQERAMIMGGSPVAGLYDQPADRESAYETLKKRAKKAALDEAEAARRENAEEKRDDELREEQREEKAGWFENVFGTRSSKRSGYKRQGYVEAATKSVIRSVSSQVGRQIGRAVVRGILGGLRR
ncbi:helicase HerA-like C-terminal domain-containing protein [Notoacmeibacter sp. MSK16QG-6]|uniref:helicase HerA-like C-terminal domain-containing protein n=1 Tax=Notoacmeibacter sp. MSK16QG-6 TaxID=2957982 RepID=UPI00209EC0FA|nr:helicase HerA-like C-terminal domain-containing protein [Notoacmeibacter sp. MSK16QG-6]MCP1198170.1 DUF853 domain-containing protein [Notoacmeibacter sp. MSK16QG-6]